MPQPSNCPTPEVLLDLLLGRLSEAEAAPLEQHLEACDRCSAGLEALQADDELTGVVRQALAVPEHPDPEELKAYLDQLKALAASNPVATMDQPGPAADNVENLG